MHPWLETAFSGKKTSNTFREFIIYDNLQAFPAYIIYYAREYWADPQQPQGRAVGQGWPSSGVEKAASVSADVLPMDFIVSCPLAKISIWYRRIIRSTSLYYKFDACWPLWYVWFYKYSTNTVLCWFYWLLCHIFGFVMFCPEANGTVIPWSKQPTASGSDPGLAMADPVLTWAPNERCGSRSGMQRVSLKQTPQRMLGGIPVATSMALFISIDGIYILYNIIHIHMSYTCKDIYIYIYVYTCIHTDIQTYRHADMQTYRHTDIQTYIHTGRQADRQTYRQTTYIHTHCIHTVYIHTYRQTDIQTDIQTYIHTHIYIYIYIYIHTVYIHRHGAKRGHMICVYIYISG